MRPWPCVLGRAPRCMSQGRPFRGFQQVLVLTCIDSWWRIGGDLHCWLGHTPHNWIDAAQKHFKVEHISCSTTCPSMGMKPCLNPFHAMMNQQATYHHHRKQDEGIPPASMESAVAPAPPPLEPATHAPQQPPEAHEEPPAAAPEAPPQGSPAAPSTPPMPGQAEGARPPQPPPGGPWATVAQLGRVGSTGGAPAAIAVAHSDGHSVAEQQAPAEGSRAPLTYAQRVKAAMHAPLKEVAPKPQPVRRAPSNPPPSSVDSETIAQRAGEWFAHNYIPTYTYTPHALMWLSTHALLSCQGHHHVRTMPVESWCATCPAP